jgi:hypothetical protein
MQGMSGSRPTPIFAAAFLTALAGCTSTADVLQPSALAPETAPGTTPSPFPLPDATAQQNQGSAPSTTAAAPISTDARVQFAPVVGATTQASTPLAARLSSRAGDRGIALVAAGDGSATHIMKGYFSAIADDGETTVIYVWDVMDPSGNRVHRIQGRATAPGAGGWAAVQPATMEAIADQTVDQLAAWLVSRTG